MIKNITQTLNLRHISFVTIFLLSTISFAQNIPEDFRLEDRKKEVIEKRDLFAKHFLNEDGSFTASIASRPVHFEKDGVFKTIDNKIKPFASSTYSYANTENLMASYFGSMSHKGIKNETKEGVVLEFLNTTMHWEVAGLKIGEQQSNNVSVSTLDNKVYYNNLYDFINAEFVVLNGKRKLNYIISSAEAFANAPSNTSYLVFTEKVVIPSSWTHEMTKNGLVIRNAQQEQIYLYSNPYSFDGSGKMLRSNNTIMSVEREDNTLTIATKVKTDWLLNVDRVYPITVDPTVSVYPYLSSYGTGTVYSADYFKETEIIGFGRLDDFLGVEDFVRGWAKFDTTSIPEDAIVDNGVTINFYVNAASPDYSPAYGHELVFSQLNLDPVSSTGSILYNAIEQFGYAPFVTAAINSVGWKTHTLTSASIQTDISNGLVNDYFAIGFMPQGDFFEGEFIVVDGWANNMPYLTFTYEESLGIEEFDTSVMSIYPNPVEDVLTVATDYEVVSIEVYSLIGQLVQANTNKNLIDVSSLAKGIYMTKIRFENGQVLTKKIVKE